MQLTLKICLPSLMSRSLSLSITLSLSLSLSLSLYLSIYLSLSLCGFSKRFLRPQRHNRPLTSRPVFFFTSVIRASKHSPRVVQSMFLHTLWVIRSEFLHSFWIISPSFYITSTVVCLCTIVFT